MISYEVVVDRHTDGRYFGSVKFDVYNGIRRTTVLSRTCDTTEEAYNVAMQWAETNLRNTMCQINLSVG